MGKLWVTHTFTLFWHSSNNGSTTDKNDPKNVRQGKLRHISHLLNDAYSKYHTTSKYLAVNKLRYFLKWE
jgi:hypothetical protein